MTRSDLGRATPFIRNTGDQYCTQCSKFVDIVIVIGEPPNYDSATASLCRPCFEKAARLFTSWTPE